MGLFEIIAGLFLVIYGILGGINWKKISNFKRLFVIIAIGAASFIAWNTFIKSDETSRDYIIKNRAKLSPILYIDEMKSDTVYFHLEVKNNNPISAKNLIYAYTVNKKYYEKRFGKIGMEIAKDEINAIYTNLETLKIIKPKYVFNIEIYFYYDSIWLEDTLHHKEKFKFAIPVIQLSEKRYDPTEKLTDNILSLAQLDSIQYFASIYNQEGTLTFVLTESDQKDSISYILYTDSLKLIYSMKTQEIIFHRIFANEQLVLRKLLNKLDKKEYFIQLAWKQKYYKLYVNADSAEIRIKAKYPYPGAYFY